MRIDAVVKVLAALAVAVSASPVSTTSHVVHERRSQPAHQWEKHSRLHPAAVFPVRIGLTQQNLHRAEEFINEVAHPASKKYGQHWSKDKVAEMFAPKQETVDLVKAWLSESGIELTRVRATQSRNWLTFNASASEVERLLKAEYHVYNHETGEKRMC